MLEFHDNQTQKVTVMATEATKAQSMTYGCIVEDKNNHSMLHYVEKPQSYISPIINCGVYVFSLSIFELLAQVFDKKQRDFYNNGSGNIEAKESMWIEKDIFVPLAGKYHFYHIMIFCTLESRIYLLDFPYNYFHKFESPAFFLKLK